MNDGPACPQKAAKMGLDWGWYHLFFHIMHGINEIRPFSGALKRTLGVLWGHIWRTFFASLRLNLRPCGERRVMRKMVAAFLPLLQYALFRNNSTQTHVADNKWLREYLLDSVVGCTPWVRQIVF